MSEQARLRRRIAALERLQIQRIELVEQMKRDLDATIEKKALEIENLRAQLTIGVVA